MVIKGDEPMKMHEKIRHIIETTPGLTQKGLAEQMGLNPAAINRMLYGRRHIMVDEVPVIENYLGVTLSQDPVHLTYHQDSAQRRRGFSDQPAAALEMPVKSWGDMMVPVLGTVDGQLSLGERKIIDWAPRHPAQIGINDAFALYAADAAMEPRYMPGELVYVHPGRMPEKGKDCLVIPKDGPALVRRFAGQTEKNWRVAQFNPARETNLPVKDIRTIMAVIGRG